jgi:hypothetical protein
VSDEDHRGGRTIFRGEQWTIANIKCVPGDYVVKDAI